MRAMYTMCCVMFMIGCGGGKAEVKPDAKQVEGGTQEVQEAILSPDGLSGSYTETHAGQVGNDQDGYTPTDMMQCLYVVQAQDKQSVMFKLALLQDNMKRCLVAGAAQLDAANSSEDYTVWTFTGDGGCTLRIAQGAGQLSVVDDGGACKAAYCDPEAAITTIQFSESTRAAGDLCGAAKQ